MNSWLTVLVPLLLIVIVCPGPAEPTACFPKSILAGETSSAAGLCAPVAISKTNLANTQTHTVPILRKLKPCS
jgi:hypothetical protein